MKESGKVAAFFDLDGTVIAPPSLEFRFAAYLARRGELRGAAVFSWLGDLLKAGMKALVTRGGTSARLKALDENKSYLAGVREQAAAEWAREKVTQIECYADALARIEWHREQSHSIFFVSGTLAPLARALAKRIARGDEIGVFATEMQSFAGVWTGCAAGASVCGAAKASAVRDLAARHEIDLEHSYAYGDSLSDRWMLAAVGNATAVNPGARLMWLARRRGWRVANWSRVEPGFEIMPEAAKRQIPRWEKS
ncbi:MAG: HAD-IB family hydrolase [Candidatus Acidiferrales bacterium]